MKKHFVISAVVLASATGWLWLTRTSHSVPPAVAIHSTAPAPAPAIEPVTEPPPSPPPTRPGVAEPDADRHSSTVTAAAGAPPPLVPADLPKDLHEQIRAAQGWFAQSFDADGRPRLVASVRGQKFDFIAGENGVTVRPWSPTTDWSWRMTPADGTSARPAPDKTRVSYVRGNGVTEWFENGDLGIEQGFTLATGGGEPVRKVALSVTTELRPQLRPDADGVDFLDASGAAQLHYDQLHAFDAEGRMLPAWMELREPETHSRKPETRNPEPGTHTLALAVDTTGAKYPVTIDPVISLASERIEHPDLVAGDLFGVTVAAWGDLIAIGAPLHQVGAVPNAGAVYVFRRGLSELREWDLLQRVDAPHPHNPGEFGRALALSETGLAVSARRLTLVNGGDVLQDVVQVFQLSGTPGTYTLRATLSDPTVNYDPADYFGRAVSFGTDGTRLAVGSPASLASGNPSPVNTGRVFLHGRDIGGPDNWGLIQTYQPPVLVPASRFGVAVAADGAHLAVSAPGYVELPGHTNGTVFLYEDHPLVAQPIVHSLHAPAQPGNVQLQGFGARVAISGRQLAVGAPGSDVIVVYERRAVQLGGVPLLNSDWVSGLLKQSGPATGVGEGGTGTFGGTFDLSQGTLVVASKPAFGTDGLIRFEHQGDAGGNPAYNWTRESSQPVEVFSLRGIANLGISGGLLVITSTNDNYGTGLFNHGVAVAMLRRGGSWLATQRFLADLPLAAGDLAGSSLAVSDDLLVVGAPGHDVSGVADSGAVHVFRRYSGIAPDAQTLQHGWTLATTLVNDTPQENGRLGASVAVADGLVVAGAPGRNFASGTVWVWQRTSELATSWTGHTVVGAPGAAQGDEFGAALSFNGVTLAVGSPGAGAGRVDLFRREPADPWTHLKTLNGQANDQQFGAALALDVDGSLIVGAPEADAGAMDAGRAYFYRRVETETPPFAATPPDWIEEGVISGVGESAQAGAGVALHRGWALIGAPGEAFELGPPTRGGRVHVMRRNLTGSEPWGEAALLSPPSSVTSVAQFGRAVALDEHTAVVGARGAELGGASSLAPGAAFVYSRLHGGEGAWRHTATLFDLRGEAGDRFGHAVALDHDKIFVGAPRADVSGANSVGTVTLFERQGATWSLQREVPDDSTHRIGKSMAVDGDWLLLGSSGDWDLATEGESDAGQVYVLKRHDGFNGGWNVVNRVLRPNPFGTGYSNTDYFGRSVDLSGGTFVVGSAVGVHTFELSTDGQVVYLGPLIGHADDVEYGYDVAIHGQHVAVTAAGSSVPTARGSVAFFARTAEHTVPFGAFNVQTHWKRESRQTSMGHGFGRSVDLHGTTAVVGAPNDGYSGIVYFFQRNRGGTGNWGLADFIEPEIGNEGYQPRFGTGVALEGDTVVVGLLGQAEDNGDGTYFYDGGGAMIFQRHAGGFNNWGQVGGVRNGPAVAIGGDWVLAGGPAGYEEDDNGNVTYFANPAVLHHRNAGGADRWGQAQAISAPNPNREHTWDFGAAVALDGTTLVIGAPGERRSARSSTTCRSSCFRPGRTPCLRASTSRIPTCLTAPSAISATWTVTEC